MKKVDLQLQKVDPKLTEAIQDRRDQAIKWLGERWVCHPKRHVKRKSN